MESLWIPSSSSALQGEKTVMEHESVNGGDDDLDGWCHSRAGKKRRLTATQVEFLERSFEVENKLEAERKLQLAKQVGLQPRQVAIWFQNRRARSKNKQLEKDYDSLKASFDKLKADFDNLLKEKHDLQNELLALKEKVLIGEKGIGNLGSLDEPQKPNSDTTSHVPLMACKEEEACSAKSDIVFESDSPHYIDGHGQEGYHSSFIEPADSSNVFEQDKSDEEDNLISNPALFFPEFDCYYDIRPTSCNFTLPVEDQSFWSSLY